ncbi:MAG: ATPase [Parvularcula sp.]|uniref:division plane positioning ATPase MipZ n=1 Tax=Hyphococcus sp. TaxID=2038636 RepID=UPI000C5F50D9|nr:ATPase [Parvularcula sp.]
MTHVIVLGNEKGGSGKSTTAMHLIVALLRSGKKVGAMDLDLRQGSLSRYLENRRKFCENKGKELVFPTVVTVEPSSLDSRAESQKKETENLKSALKSLSGCDFVVIDCPGANTHLSRLAHLHADTIVTPLNDSFVDFDLLAKVDPATGKVLGPSLYSEMVWTARKQRAMMGVRGGIDWIVMRNRLSATRARNKKTMGDKLEELSSRIGFRLARGFGDRVIYRELFPIGLTLLDLGGVDSPVRLSTMSHVTARLEIRSLVASLKLPAEDEQPEDGESSENGGKKSAAAA